MPGLTRQVQQSIGVGPVLRADSCRAGADPQTLILMVASRPNHEEVLVGAL